MPLRTIRATGARPAHFYAADRLLEIERGWSAATGLEGADPIQRRTFVYDGLGRLVRESLPESGTTAFTYDANGNLKTGIDDRGKRPRASMTLWTG